MRFLFRLRPSVHGYPRNAGLWILVIVLEVSVFLEYMLR